MKTIEEAAEDYVKPYDTEFMRIADLNDRIDQKCAFKDGVKFAQKYISIRKELPQYYSPVIGIVRINKVETPISVWRAWSETFGDIYTIMGTDIILGKKIIKWRPIELK